MTTENKESFISCLESLHTNMHRVIDTSREGPLYRDWKLSLRFRVKILFTTVISIVPILGNTG
jgi:hypothetical protein